MFDKYLNKKIRILVSTKSGAGISNGDIALGTAFNSIITVIGVFNNMDDKFIEVSNSKMIYYNGAAETFVPSLSNKEITGPDVYENDYSLLNIDNIISISILRDK